MLISCFWETAGNLKEEKKKLLVLHLSSSFQVFWFQREEWREGHISLHFGSIIFTLLPLHTSEAGNKEISLNFIYIWCWFTERTASFHSHAGTDRGGTDCRSMWHGYSHGSPISPFLPHFWASHLAWDASASAHHSLWEELSCIPVPHLIFGFSLWETTERKKYICMFSPCWLIVP